MIKLHHTILISVLAVSISTFAEIRPVITTVQESTTITGIDAINFQKTFGESYYGTSGFYFICKDSICTVTSRSNITSPISNMDAEALLKGRKEASFSNRTGMRYFSLNCSYPPNGSSCKINHAYQTYSWPPGQ